MNTQHVLSIVAVASLVACSPMAVREEGRKATDVDHMIVLCPRLTTTWSQCLEKAVEVCGKQGFTYREDNTSKATGPLFGYSMIAVCNNPAPEKKY